MRFVLLAWLAVACSHPAAPGAVNAPAAGVEDAPAARAEEAPACAALAVNAADLHVDLPYQVHYRGRPVSLDQPGGDLTAASLRQGRVRLLVLSLFLRSGFRVPRHTLDDFHELLATAERIVADNPALFAGAEPVHYIYSVESSHALAGHEHVLPALVARGVRIFGLTHMLHNQLADSATDRRRPYGGLRPAGERFVRAVYAAGGLIDVSHVSDAAFADIAALAREQGKPLIATHSNARAVTPHPRNLTDEQLRAIAASGGLAGINFHTPYLRADAEQAALADVVRHAVHMVAIMGPEHVAIGSDLDGGIRPAAGLATHAGLGALMCALRASGMSPATIRALAGGNAMRVLGSYTVQP